MLWTAITLRLVCKDTLKAAANVCVLVDRGILAIINATSVVSVKSVAELAQHALE